MKGYSVFDRKKIIAIILAALIAIASIITLYATVLPAGTDSSNSELPSEPAEPLPPIQKCRLRQTLYGVNEKSYPIAVTVYEVTAAQLGDQNILYFDCVIHCDYFYTTYRNDFACVIYTANEEELLFSPLSFNETLTNALSPVKLQKGVHGSAKLAFNMGKEDYEFLYDRRTAGEDESLPYSDVILQIPGCRGNFNIYADEIKFSSEHEYMRSP